MSTFAQQLRLSRLHSGLTLAEVGASCGLSGGYVANIEHGRKGPPSVDKVASMARAMGAKPALLVMLALHERHSEEERSVIQAYYQARLGDATTAHTAESWNAAHPVGTRVRYWPVLPPVEGIEPVESVTRMAAWTFFDGTPVVAIKGMRGGVNLTHVEVLP